MYGILTSEIEDKAITILKNVRGENGLEAWRRLREEFDSTAPAMCLRNVVNVVSPGKAADEKGANTKIEEWEVLVSRVEKEHGQLGEDLDSKIISDKLKIAIVTSMCPPSLIEAVYNNINTKKEKYIDFKKELKRLIENRNAAHTPMPMDIGNLDWEEGWYPWVHEGDEFDLSYVGKGGGGKGMCYGCGGFGHYARDCPKGKGKGGKDGGSGKDGGKGFVKGGWKGKGKGKGMNVWRRKGRMEWKRIWTIFERWPMRWS